MILAVIIGILAIMVPGFFLALALLRRTGMNWFMLVVWGFIFGLIFPPTMIWAEAYLIPYIHAFTFSAGLYNANIIVLTIIGIVLSFQQGALSFDELRSWMNFNRNKSSFSSSTVHAHYKVRVSELREKISRLSVDMKIVRQHEREESELAQRHAEEMQTLRGHNAGAEEMQSVQNAHAEQERKLYEEHEREESMLISKEDKSSKSNHLTLVYGILLILMLLAFASRIVNLSVAPKFFEFDPYFDMISTQSILTYGYQLTYSHSAWPTLVNGTIESIQPIVPYLEAYWYQLANVAPASAPMNINLLSTVSSVYPPITAALLVFVVFIYLFYEYGEFTALVGAGLACAMPVLISTFIAGEQLVEPWGIFTLFLFFAAYLLAVRNPNEKRYAILAGIAFVSTFLGAHYYTVDAGILAIYIVIQGGLDVLRGKDNKAFYLMNAIVIAVITIFFALYNPYTTAITNSIPNVIGVPTIIAFPLFGLIAVLIFEYVPKLAHKRGYLKRMDRWTYPVWLGVLLVVILLLITFTPVGKPVRDYVNLSTHFTTPSSPLFMTVQEYAVTGLTFNFGNNGFGIVGASVFGIPLLIWLVLAVYFVLEANNIIRKDSRSSVLTLSIVLVLAVAGFSEVKYLPHLGVAYILALGIIVGELYLYLKGKPELNKNYMYAFYGICAFIVLLEATSLVSVFAAAANPNCNALSAANSTNILGLNLYCNQVPGQWLSAMAWASKNVGPTAPRILSWWDYGDWINWFGNSYAVIRGDNSVASYDYQVAAQYVLGTNDSYGSNALSHFMDSAQAEYVLFDDQLLPKWSALDFLACVDINQTSQAFATSAGQQYSQPFLIGTSQCEISHDPVDLNIPSSPAISDYCSFSNSSVTAVYAIMTVGLTVPQLVNQTYCVSTTPTKNNVLNVYYPNGTKANLIVSATQPFYNGARQFSQGGSTYLSFTALYLPNAPNNKITDAPTKFYNSDFYRGFFLGGIPKFQLVYPENFSGINLVNSTNDVMIFQLVNYTGGLPSHAVKPSWVVNNYSIPG